MLKTTHFVRTKLHPIICGRYAESISWYSQGLEAKYNEDQKEKILGAVNHPEQNTLLQYEITKVRYKKLSDWRQKHGQFRSLTDVAMADGLTEKVAAKLFNSIVNENHNKTEKGQKIKGQVLHPNLSEEVRKNCKTIVSVYITVNSVCWAAIDRATYEVVQWKYHGIDYPEGKKFQITDIFDIAWRVTRQLPPADVFVLKGEARSLRAPGADPAHPKVLAVNLQKAQLVSMVVALINAGNRNNADESKMEQCVYFLRPTLPFRLYGTLIGNERVSTEQTVEMLLQDVKEKSTDGSTFYVSEELRNMFRSKLDLQKDMLGHCLLLGLTFMDLCIYRNQSKINKLLSNS